MLNNSCTCTILYPTLTLTIYYGEFQGKMINSGKLDMVVHTCKSQSSIGLRQEGHKFEANLSCTARP
jgi:hypothetical protein